jgi:pre-mRNA-splicing factor ATP-dependent RNA helicase DHX16
MADVCLVCLQALTAGFFFNAAKLQRSGNYRTIKNKQTVHMHPQNGLSEVCYPGRVS